MKSAMSSFLNIRDMEYTCKDCIFFDNGTCKEEKFGRDVDAEDNSCTTFEFNKILINKVV